MTGSEAASWVQASATVVAFVALVVEVRRNRRQSKRAELEERQAMARSVGVKSYVEVDALNIRAVTVHYTVKNFGRYPVDDLVLLVDDPTPPSHHPELPRAVHALELVFGSVLPGDEEAGSVELEFREPVGSFRFLNGPAYVQFVDSWGQPWERGPGILQKLSAPPRAC